jgi:dolichol-phosphate mannosyltransferase
MKAVILIPTFNEATSIVELLNSLSEITNRENFNVVVLDDNSPDKTADIVDSMKFSWVQVIRRPGKLV